MALPLSSDGLHGDAALGRATVAVPAPTCDGSAFVERTQAVYVAGKMGAEMGIWQTTLNGPVEFAGVGLHSGVEVRAVLRPAPANTGIVFVRTDAPNVKQGTIVATFENVYDTMLSSRICNEYKFCVGTIEHLMAALSGAGIDNALIEIDNSEVPIMDGSARDFMAPIEQVGARELTAPRRMIWIKRALSVERDGSVCELLPDIACSFEAEIDFDNPVIGQQSYAMTLADNGFGEHLACSRTFCLSNDIEAVRAAGLGCGGSMANAIIVDHNKVLNDDGLRTPDEFVRHKLLDAVGDMYLAGLRIIGRYRGRKAGHKLNNELLNTLFNTPDAFEIVTLDGSQSS